MKIYNKLTWAVLLLVIGMYACTQQGEQVVPGANLTPMTNKAEIKTKFDQRRANFAKALAKAMRNSEVRDFIKTEASKKFDGDFDIHFGMTKDAKVGQSTFLQTIQNNLAVENGRINKGAFMTDVLNEDPLLNIAVPVHINDWNVANYQPLVAVLTEAYDDQKSSHIVAYDAEGKEHWIDAKNEPNVPVVVVGWNERLKSTTEYQQRVRDISIIQPCEEEIMLRTAPAYTTPDGKQAFYHYNFADIALRCSGGGGGGGGGTGGGSGSGSGSGSSSCLRPGKAYERLVDMYFTKSGLNKYEGWPAGAPEVDLRVYTPDKDRNYDEAKRMRFIDDMEPRKRKDIKDKWWNPGNLSRSYALKSYVSFVFML